MPCLSQPGQELKFKLESGKSTSRKLLYKLPGAHPPLPAPITNTDMVLEWALPVLLKLLSLEDLTMVLGCAMCEMQCVFVCEDVSSLSAAVTATVGLLRPLKWACPIIVTLPTSLHIYLESPVPVFLGVTSLPQNHVPPPGQCIVHLEGGGKGQQGKTRVQLSEEDMAKYIQHVMPGVSELCHKLSADYMRVQGLGKPKVITGKRGLSPVYGMEVSEETLLGMRRFVDVVKSQVEWLVGTAGREEGDAELGGAKGGEAGQAFMRRLMSTQMYSAYTFEQKLAEKIARRARANEEFVDTYTPYTDGNDDESVDGGEERQQLNPRTMRRRATATHLDNFHSRNSGVQDFG